jgi:hypothetical protein
MAAKLFAVGCAVLLGMSVAIKHARAQAPPPWIYGAPPPQQPTFNPSSPLTVPQAPPIPLSPQTPSALPGSGARLQLAPAPCSVLNGRPCHPTFCGADQRGPCFPEYPPPIGQDLRLTIVSTDENDPAGKSGSNADNGSSGADNSSGEANAAAGEQPLDSISALYAALRACWVPPPKDRARRGMEYTIRFALKRDGEIVAPPRVTYASHDAPAAVREVYHDAVDAALKRCMPLHFSDAMGGAVAGRPVAIRFLDSRTIDNGKSPQ